MCVCEKNESKTRCHSVFETIEFVFTEFSSLVSPIIGKICKKELNFKEKQKCNMRDWVIFIILFSFPLSLRMCVTLPPARASKKLFQRNPPLHPKISGIFEYLTGGRLIWTCNILCKYVFHSYILRVCIFLKKTVTSTRSLQIERMTYRDMFHKNL